MEYFLSGNALPFYGVPAGRVRPLLISNKNRSTFFGGAK